MHLTYTGENGPTYRCSLEQGPLSEIDQMYRLLCKSAFCEGIESSPRGMPIKELLGCHLILQDPRSRVITSAARAVKPRYLAGEFAWYMSGDRKISRIIKYSSFWSQLADEKGEVNSNYGEKIFYRSGVFNHPDCQFNKAIAELKSDPDSRRVIINIHTPTESSNNPKDVPCTLAIQFFLRDSRLHAVVTMRSNDLVLGFCNDVFQFTLIQELLAARLQAELSPDIKLGTYTHIAGSMHFYDKHLDTVKAEVFDDPRVDPKIAEFANTLPVVPFALTSSELDRFKVELMWTQDGGAISMDNSRTKQLSLALGAAMAGESK